MGKLKNIVKSAAGEVLDKLTKKTEGANRLFSASNLSGGKHSSSVFNREYLLSQTTADELNTYRTFSPFQALVDIYNEKEYSDAMNIKDEASRQEALKKIKANAWGVRSIFNKSGSVLLGNGDNKDVTKISPWRASNNVPLMDTREARKVIKKMSDCTVKELVKASQEGSLGKETYDYSDFMYCKYLGKISNNYMITLRRFPFPVDDFISSIGDLESRKKRGFQTNNPQSIGCMVTWMGTPGNEMGNILKYSYSMPFKMQEADWEDVGTNMGDTQKGILNGLSALMDPKYREQYSQGMGGEALNSLTSMFGIKSNISGPYNANDFENFRDKNKIYGPVDAIKKTYMRDRGGLEFDQTITITFDYELRSYNGINGRQALLDLLSNILSVTYTTGTFWGGGYKSMGQHQSNLFTNLEIFKVKGDSFTAISESVGNDVKNVFGNVKDVISKNGGILNTLKQIGNSMSGLIAAAGMNMLGRPAKQMIHSLLSPAPVGFWHLTIGNPHHPIMSMGNMILKRTTIEHYGPLGLDDFPTGIKVTCELERGKPRDLRGIEQLYMHGNDRIYTPMGAKIFDMYQNAKEYNDKALIPKHITNDSEISSQAIDDPVYLNRSGRGDSHLNKVLKKYFGHQDTYSIYVASMEQEWGTLKKTGAAGGDSRAK